MRQVRLLAKGFSCLADTASGGLHAGTAVVPPAELVVLL